MYAHLRGRSVMEALRSVVVEWVTEISARLTHALTLMPFENSWPNESRVSGASPRLVLDQTQIAGYRLAHGARTGAYSTAWGRAWTDFFGNRRCHYHHCGDLTQQAFSQFPFRMCFASNGCCQEIPQTVFQLHTCAAPDGSAVTESERQRIQRALHQLGDLRQFARGSG